MSQVDELQTKTHACFAWRCVMAHLSLKVDGEKNPPPNHFNRWGIVQLDPGPSGGHIDDPTVTPGWFRTTLNSD
jgi:hypothetical protein